MKVGVPNSERIKWKEKREIEVSKVKEEELLREIMVKIGLERIDI